MHPDELAMRRTIAYAGGAVRIELCSVLADWLDDAGRYDEATGWRVKDAGDCCDCCGAPTRSCDEGCLHKETWWCEFCGTTYDFSFGFTHRYIDGQEFDYAYHDTTVNREKVRNVAHALALRRNALFKED